MHIHILSVTLVSFTLRFITRTERKLACLCWRKKKTTSRPWGSITAFHPAGISFRFDKFDCVTTIFILVTKTIRKLAGSRVTFTFRWRIDARCLHPVDYFPIIFTIPIVLRFTKWVGWIKWTESRLSWLSLCLAEWEDWFEWPKSWLCERSSKCI